MGVPEYPDTDVQYMKRELVRMNDAVEGLRDRLDKQAEGINAIGGNLQWLVQNTQGLFQMFASPQFVSQMSNMLMGGMPDAGPQDGPADSDGADPG
jgi:hypothetical protein